MKPGQESQENEKACIDIFTQTTDKGRQIVHRTTQEDARRISIGKSRQHSIRLYLVAIQHHTFVYVACANNYPDYKTILYLQKHPTRH